MFNKVKKAIENSLQKTQITKRDFSYKKGNCSLNFTLNIEEKNELKDFIECLTEAEKDINKLLEN